MRSRRPHVRFFYLPRPIFPPSSLGGMDMVYPYLCHKTLETAVQKLGRFRQQKTTQAVRIRATITQLNFTRAFSPRRVKQLYCYGPNPKSLLHFHVGLYGLNSTFARILGIIGKRRCTGLAGKYIPLALFLFKKADFIKHFSAIYAMVLSGWSQCSLLLCIFTVGLFQALHAQDSTYSHWPEVQQTHFDPVLQKRVQGLVEDLLMHFMSRRQKANPTDQTGPRWEVFKKAEEYVGSRDFTAATETANNALKMARDAKDKLLETKVLLLIGFISREVFLGASLKGVPYIQQALQIAEERQDTLHMVESLTALADHYGQAGQNQRFLEYTEAAALLLKAQKGRHYILAVSNQFAIFLSNIGAIDDAEKIYALQAECGHQLKNNTVLRSVYWQMLDMYLNVSDVKNAQRAIDSLLSFKTVKQEELYEMQYKLEKLKGNREKAFQYLEKAYQYLGVSYLERSGEQLASWETRLRTREKELQLEAQKRERTTYLALSVLLGMLFLGALYTVYQQRKSRRKLTAQKNLIEQQADELRQVDKMKSIFFSNVSHELRTPITLILGPLEQTLIENGLPPRGKRLLEIARSNSRHLLELVNQLLELGRVEHMAPTLHETPTEVGPFLSELVSTFQPTAESKYIQFTFDNQLSPNFSVALDRPKWRGVFTNLLVNALKFTPSKGAVSFSASQADGTLNFEIRDSGSGIHAEDLPHIFERYYQSRRPGYKAEGGFGIGLSLVRETVQLMGGTIKVESEVGHGTAFFIALPFNAANQSDAITSAVPDEAPHTGASPAAPARILVVEDSANLREYLRMALPANQYRVQFAENGRDALEQLASAKRLPDLIITDLMMPEMDGVTLLGHLKNDVRYTQIPVIVLTARATGREELEALRIGVDDYLLKPFNTVELMAHMAQLLANARAKQATLETDEAEDEAVKSDLSINTQAWLDALQLAAIQHVGDPDFNLEILGTMMDLSSRQLLRRLKAATGLTSAQYLQELRLQQARHLLMTGQVLSVKAAGESVGLRDVKYFSQMYKKRFGKLPSESL